MNRAVLSKGVACFAFIAIALVPAFTEAAPVQTEGRRSGFDFMTPALRSMQEDETSNPGLLWVKEGEAQWAADAGTAGRSCASCHGDATTSMRGVASRYPAFDERSGRPIDLAGRINTCRASHQGAAPLDRDDDTLLALEAFVARQSRGLPLTPPVDARLDPSRVRGEATFRRRMGQLDLSCAQCHDDHAGQRLAGSVIPQAHPTGYPLYRLEWQSLGSLVRRLRGCMTGVRAEPFEKDAAEWIELELYLMQRAAGLRMESPAVRP